MAGPGSDIGGRHSGQFGPDFYQHLPVGGQLGHLEYLVKQEDLELYRSAVGYPEAGFPSLAVDECRQVFFNKYGAMPLTGVRHQEWYYRPPFVERRVQVSGWIREKYRLHGRDWLVVGTFSVGRDRHGSPSAAGILSWWGKKTWEMKIHNWRCRQNWPTADSGKGITCSGKTACPREFGSVRSPNP